MLTENAGMPGAATVRPSLSSDEASQLRALRDALPGGWVVALQAESGMAWLAFVYQADAPRAGPCSASAAGTTGWACSRNG